jgi:hypothetical protein
MYEEMNNYQRSYTAAAVVMTALIAMLIAAGSPIIPSRCCY